MSKKSKVIVGLAMAISLVAAPIAPARAGTVTSDVAFVCTTEMLFPGSSMGCWGNAIGGASGLTDSGTRYEIAGTGPALSNSFYMEAHTNDFCLRTEPSLLGEAWGTARFDITIGLPGTISTDFYWIRLGAALVLATSNTRAESTAGTATATAPAGTGVAIFAPLLTAANTCPAGGFLRATVAGTLANAL